jgi:hypothetical protein
MVLIQIRELEPPYHRELAEQESLNGDPMNSILSGLFIVSQMGLARTVGVFFLVEYLDQA